MMLKLDPADLSENPELLGQIRAALTEAVHQPAFLGALVAQPAFEETLRRVLTPDKIYLSYAQVRAFLDLPKTTFYEWKARHKGRLEVSYGIAAREPRIKLASILAVMDDHKVTAAAPVTTGEPATITQPRSRLPAAALRDVALTTRTT